MLFSKGQYGWRLIKQSLAVFKEQKTWLLLPLLGRSLFLAILGGIAVFTWAIKTGVINYKLITSAEWILIYVGILVAFFIANVISVYFSNVLTAYLLGESGFQVANRRFTTTFLWLLTHLTMGLLVTWLPKQFNRLIFFQRLLLGLPWPSACFFVPPILVHESYGVFQSIAYSSRLMRNYAGETPKVRFGFFGIMVAMRLLAFIPVIIGWMLGGIIWATAGVIISAIFLYVIAILHAAMITVFQLALYQYIAHQKTMSYFNTADLARAFIRT